MRFVFEIYMCLFSYSFLHSQTMFQITQTGRFANKIALLGKVNNVYSMIILQHSIAEEEALLRIRDNSQIHTTLYDASTGWWSIYNVKSLNSISPFPEIPCNLLTLLDTDGLTFPFVEYGISQTVWNYIVGAFHAQ